MSTLSAHVLDTALGRPAAKMRLSLEKQSRTENWETLGDFQTDADGRVAKMKISSGTYRLTFHTQSYFKKQKKKCFYPYATITFIVGSRPEHYHVPLLLSGWGYSTYRGS